MDTNILLESGTNELEVLEFTLGDNHYGINVAKIREILQYTPVTPVPNSHPSVEGIFRRRLPAPERNLQQDRGGEVI